MSARQESYPVLTQQVVTKISLTYKTHFCIVTTSKSKFLSIKEFKMKKRYGAWMGCQIAVEKGLGNSVSDLNDIKLTGDITDLSNIDLIGDMPENGPYPFDLYQAFPQDIEIIKGSARACREGCVNNPLAVLQSLYFDYGGKGGWTLLMGKGHDHQKIDSINGRVLIAGPCAIKEVSESLITRLGKKNVYLTGECNNLCDTVSAMAHLMEVNPADIVPVNIFVSVFAWLMAKKNGSTSRVPNPLSHIFKMV